jgi:hypothetical protein
VDTGVQEGGGESVGDAAVKERFYSFIYCIFSYSMCVRRVIGVQTTCSGMYQTGVSIIRVQSS